VKFNELHLHEKVLAGIKNAGFEECMPVQEMVLPVSLTGRDVMVQSKTGSGKTAVFVITFLEEYLRRRDSGMSSSCLIIAPTRELAQQIAADATLLCSGIPGFHVGCFVGGVGYERQRKLLQMGCDIYVGTPGRILDFITSGQLSCSGIDTFVIDEADRLFDMGFYPDLKRIFSRLVPRERRQTMLFSATLEMRVRELAWEYMNNPQEIELEPDTMTVESITQELYHVAKADKLHLLLQLLAVEKPKAALIFTNSRHMTMELAKCLACNGWNTDHISGDLTQTAREKALEKIKTGRTTILVATDVAARGLQIDNLPLVVNYDIPEDYENYVHRIGRTARAGKSGKAITLADEEFVYGLEAIEKYIKMKIPVIWPDNLPEVEVKIPPRASEKRRKKTAPRNAALGQKTPPHKDRHTSGGLGSMNREQRLDYYRKKYGFEPSQTVVRSETSRQQPAGHKTAKPEAAIQETVNQEAARPEAPKKEKGFFSRLFGRFGKKRSRI